MAGTISITHARSQLPRLAEEFRAHPDQDALALTKRGEPVLALMPWDLYETLIDTLDILSDPDEIQRFRNGLQDLKEGRAVLWEKVKAELDI